MPTDWDAEKGELIYTSSMSKIYTIAQVLATPEGQYVSAEVFAVLQNPTPPRGKGPWTAQLTDSTGQITGKFWGGDVSYWAGKRVKLSGKGMQRKGYNGVPELSVGQTVNLSFAGAPGTAAQEDEIPGMEAQQTAPQRTIPQGSAYTPPVRQNAPTGSGMAANGTQKNGQTVGMAVKAAVDIWLASLKSQNVDFVWGENSSAEVMRIARDIVAVSEEIQNGEEPPF